ALWPWRRPVWQERYSEPPINHDGDRVKLVDLEEFSWPYPGFAEIVVHEASWPNFTIQSDKRLGCQMACGFREGAGALVSTINGSSRNIRQAQLFGIVNGGSVMTAASRSSPSSTLRYSPPECPTAMLTSISG